MEARPEDQLSELGIGLRIQELREAKEMSVSTLAAKAKITPDMMRKIETQKVSPGLVTLSNISKALNVGIDILFAPREHQETIELTRVSDRITVHRSDAGRQGPAHYGYQALSYRLKGKRMETFMARFDGASSKTPEPISHQGEEFCYCVEGKIDFITEERTLRLTPGDTLHFYSQTPHVFQGAGSGKATAIFILLPEP